MATITTQNPSNLDHSNRFFEDNKRKMNEMIAYGDPEYSYQEHQQPNQSTGEQLISVNAPRPNMPTGGQQLGSKNRAWPSNVKIPKYFVCMENNRPVHYVVNPEAGQIRSTGEPMPKSAMKQQQTTQQQQKKQVSEADE